MATLRQAAEAARQAQEDDARALLVGHLDATHQGTIPETPCPRCSTLEAAFIMALETVPAPIVMSDESHSVRCSCSACVAEQAVDLEGLTWDAASAV